MYKLDLSNDTVKFLRSLPHKQYKQIVDKMFELLRDSKQGDVKHLVGCAGYLRVDQGEYRIIFKIDNGVVLIPLIGKRNDDDVYKRFLRR